LIGFESSASPATPLHDVHVMNGELPVEMWHAYVVEVDAQVRARDN
jgi:hypothetical protein